ncbi:MAG TPA: DNA polymerase III subunit, partial [Candidatus Limnocylindrales bacterium]|nr:DNA polymerase III subunit [Candidatus Limnocylindrales bacterium]
MSFELLLGQHELRRAITGALHDGSMSHAILLTGAPGSGKKSWGRALAQVLLCSKNIAAESCLQCDSCRRFSSGNHPDYYLLQPEGRNIKIEQIRALRSRFYLQGTTKVCMIEKAEMMTAESCSSLLKILEDPPSELYFILLSEQPRLLFSTIVSRCQRYHLHPMDTADLKALLLRENEMNPEKAAFLAR